MQFMWIIENKLKVALWKSGLLMLTFCYLVLDHTSSVLGITPEEFARSSEDQQKTALLDGIQKIRQKCANISLKTTSRVQKADVNPTTMKVDKILEDFGLMIFELRRIDASDRFTLTQFRPGIKEPTMRCTDYYDAESGVNYGVATERLANGKDQEHGLISTKHVNTYNECRYTSILGGFQLPIFPENDFIGFLLDHKNDLQIRGIDKKNGLVEAGFTYSDQRRSRNGSCIYWFDLGKNWMITRRVWEATDTPDPTSKTYERFEVNQSGLFDGVWMPTKFTDVTFTSGRDLPAPVGNLWETSAENIKFGQVKKEDLGVVFPPGTLVRDEITGKRWTVGASGEKLAYRDTVGGGGIVPATPRSFHSRSYLSPTFLAIGLLIIIALLVGILIFRHKRRVSS
jgi:hypothetical protein